MDPLERAIGRFDLANKEYGPADDPLRLPWVDKVFLNPPYDDELPIWVKKARGEYEGGNASLVVAILPVATDRAWWHQHIANRAAVVFLRGLIAFNNDGGDSTPLALVIWGATGSPLDKVEAAYPESWAVRPND